MPTAITPLANITLSGSAQTVTFSSITAGYRDLYIVLQGSTTTAQNVFVKFNSDATTTNYSAVTMSGDGSSTTSKTVNSNYLNYWTNWDTAQNNLLLHVLDFSATDKHKSYLSRNNSTGVGVEALAGRWANTAAITSVAISAFTNFATGTSFSLFGVSA